MFITLEGIEGSGKSSVAREVATAVTQSGRKVLLTREPGSGDVGAKIREVLLGEYEISPLTELFLFLADRTNHIEQHVGPALRDEVVVICDRHADSTIVYQGYARGMDLDWLRELNRKATKGIIPDLTILLDLDPTTGLKRQTKRDRLDSEPLEFHESVRRGFLTESAREPDRWLVIDASRALNEVCSSAIEAVLARL